MMGVLGGGGLHFIIEGPLPHYDLLYDRASASLCRSKGVVHMYIVCSHVASASQPPGIVQVSRFGKNFYSSHVSIEMHVTLCGLLSMEV